MNIPANTIIAKLNRNIENQCVYSLKLIVYRQNRFASRIAMQGSTVNRLAITTRIYNFEAIINAAIFQQYYYRLMLTSTKSDFRINLKKYSSLRSSVKSSRKVQLSQTFFKLQKQSQKISQDLGYSSIVDDAVVNKINQLHKKTLGLYNRNLQFYRLNEIKLRKAVELQMIQKNYIYQKKILSSLYNKQPISIRSTTNCDKLLQQLKLLNKFLEQLYQKKRIKQIIIINQNLKQEENIIADKVNADELQYLNENLECIEPVISTDFIAEYQNICMKFGTSQPSLRPHIQIKNQIQSSREDLRMHFENKKQSKNKYLYFNKRRVLGEK